MLKNLLKYCPNLTSLSLARSKIANPFHIIQKSTPLPHLTELDLTSLKGNSISLNNLPMIKKLILNEYVPTPSFAINSASSTLSLEELYLARCGTLTETSLSQMAPYLSALKVLDMSSCHLLGDGGIRHITKYCTNLINLQLFGCYGITDRAIKEIANSCPNLIKLNLGGCKNISDNAIREISSRCIKITFLDLSCTKITDLAIRHLYNIPDIEELFLSKCKITDSGVLDIANWFSKLRALSLFSTPITDKSMKLLLSKLKDLKVLDISECNNISDSTFEQELPSLKNINLMKNSKITSRTLLQIARYCPDLTHINLRSTNSNNVGIAILVDKCKGLVAINIKECSTSSDLEVILMAFRLNKPHLKIEE